MKLSVSDKSAEDAGAGAAWAKAARKATAAGIWKTFILKIEKGLKGVIERWFWFNSKGFWYVKYVWSSENDLIVMKERRRRSRFYIEQNQRARFFTSLFQLAFRSMESSAVFFLWCWNVTTVIVRLASFREIQRDFRCIVSYIVFPKSHDDQCQTRVLLCNSKMFSWSIRQWLKMILFTYPLPMGLSRKFWHPMMWNLASW